MTLKGALEKGLKSTRSEFLIRQKANPERIIVIPLHPRAGDRSAVTFTFKEVCATDWECDA